MPIRRATEGTCDARSLRIKPESELPVAQNAGLRERVPAVFPDMQGRRGIHGQGVEAGRELVVVVEGLVPGDDLAGVASHAAHDLDEAGLGAPLRLVERPVLPDGIDQVILLELVGVRLRLREAQTRSLLTKLCRL